MPIPEIITVIIECSLQSEGAKVSIFLCVCLYWIYLNHKIVFGSLSCALMNSFSLNSISFLCKVASFFVLFSFSITLKIFFPKWMQLQKNKKREYLPPWKILRDTNNNNQLLSFSTDTDPYAHTQTHYIHLLFMRAVFSVYIWTFSFNSIGASIKAFK